MEEVVENKRADKSFRKDIGPPTSRYPYLTARFPFLRPQCVETIRWRCWLQRRRRRRLNHLRLIHDGERCQVFLGDSTRHATAYGSSCGPLRTWSICLFNRSTSCRSDHFTPSSWSCHSHFFLIFVSLNYFLFRPWLCSWTGPTRSIAISGLGREQDDFHRLPIAGGKVLNCEVLSFFPSFFFLILHISEIRSVWRWCNGFRNYEQLPASTSLGTA